MKIPEYTVLSEPVGGMLYRLDEDIHYYSKRYKKNLTVLKGFLSDGATGAFDIHSAAWWVHDMICDTGLWDDGTKITNWQASMVLSDILHEEGRYFRSFYWFWATWMFGGDKARDNGMI